MIFVDVTLSGSICFPTYTDNMVVTSDTYSACRVLFIAMYNFPFFLNYPSVTKTLIILMSTSPINNGISVERPH